MSVQSSDLGYFRTVIARSPNIEEESCRFSYQQSSEEVLAADKFDLLHKVYTYLYFRLNVYLSDILSINNGLRGSGNSTGHFVSLAGYQSLYDVLPYADRKLCEPLSTAAASLERLWLGFEGNYSLLLHTCSGIPGEQTQLLQRHFLFYQALFTYLFHVQDTIWPNSFLEYDEFAELEHFSILLEQTRDLLRALLESSDPLDEFRLLQYQEQDSTLESLVRELTILNNMWAFVHRTARTKCSSRLLAPSTACHEGDFSKLDELFAKHSRQN